MFLTERGTRIATAYVNKRFADIRAGGARRAADAALPAPQLCDASGRAGVSGLNLSNVPMRHLDNQQRDYGHR